MNYEIYGVPRFEFRISRQQLDFLMDYSSAHYDTECRFASRVGGFVYGWNNRMGIDSYTRVSASFRDLDTCLKILEIPIPSMNLKDRKIQEELASSFRDMLTFANSQCKYWHILRRFPEHEP